MRLTDIRTGATGRVVVLADGYRTSEYEVENRDGNLQCWIAAETDKKVSVQWDFKAEHELYQVDLFVDGIFQDTCSGRSRFPAGTSEVMHDLIDGGVSMVSKGKLYRHQMFFKELPRRPSGGGSARPAVGTIELRIFYEIGDKLVSPSPCDRFAFFEDLAAGVFADRSVNVKSPTHGVTYINGTRVLRGNAEKKDSEAFQKRPGLSPWATFKFFYRSKAALRDIGVTFLPNPEDFVVRFRSSVPPVPVILGSPITFKTSTSSNQGQSAENSSQRSQDPEPDLPVNTVVGNVVDSSRDPRLQSRKTLEVGMPSSVEEKAQPQLTGSECSQEPPEEPQTLEVEGCSQHDQRLQDKDGTREVLTTIQDVEMKGNKNALESEEHGVVEALEEKGRGNCDESGSEGYDSEESEGDNENDMVQDEGLERSRRVWLVENRKQVEPTVAKATNLMSYGFQEAPQNRTMVFRSIFGAPSIIDRTKSPWVPVNNNSPTPNAPLPIRSAAIQPPELQYPSGDSASSTPPKATLSATPTAAKTSHDLEGSDDPRQESPTGYYPLGNDVGVATPNTRKRKRSASLSETSGEDISQDTPETKRRRDNISSLKLELMKNIREKEEKMRMLEAALVRKNQRIAGDVSRLNQELKDLDADDLDKASG
ncbi:MAG: hypothetical protein M1839_002929 [Geoglossum umbratile]|nr:MAG: hypothetical protein M1839_002929 [Geoglossum umbratile]